MKKGGKQANKQTCSTLEYIIWGTVNVGILIIKSNQKVYFKKMTWQDNL